MIARVEGMPTAVEMQRSIDGGPDSAFRSESSYGNSGPDQFDDAERPCTGKESVSTREDAAGCEAEDESTASGFHGVHHHHEADGADAVDRDRHASVHHLVADVRLTLNPGSTSTLAAWQIC